MNVQQLYSKRFDSPAALARKNRVWQISCTHYFQKYIDKDSIVVDIASGYCEFLNAIQAKEKIAFDLNPDAKLFAAENVQVINDTFFNMKIHLHGKKADVIFASNIFEHLDSKEQVILAISECADNLNVVGGKLIILQPDIKYTGAAYWDFIDHKVALTGKALIEAGALCGLQVKHYVKKFLPYTTKSGLPQHWLFVWLYFKFMPLSGFFMGKQALLILEKKDEGIDDCNPCL
jgi:hypothetical protein